MPKTSVTYLILIGLYFNSLTMGIYAFRNFSDGNLQIGVVFSVLFSLIICLAIGGTVLAGKNKSEETSSH